MTGPQSKKEPLEWTERLKNSKPELTHRRQQRRVPNAAIDNTTSVTDANCLSQAAAVRKYKAAPCLFSS